MIVWITPGQREASHILGAGFADMGTGCRCVGTLREHRRILGVAGNSVKWRPRQDSNL